MNWVIVWVHGYFYRLIEIIRPDGGPARLGDDRIRVEALDSDCPAPNLESVSLVANLDHDFSLRYIPHYPYAVAQELEKKLKAKVITTNLDEERKALQGNIPPDPPNVVR